jgi:hypothetical protein
MATLQYSCHTGTDALALLSVQGQETELLPLQYRSTANRNLGPMPGALHCTDIPRDQQCRSVATQWLPQTHTDYIAFVHEVPRLSP